MNDARYFGLDGHQTTISLAALIGYAIGYSNEPKQPMGHSILNSLEFPIKGAGNEKTIRIFRSLIGAVRREIAGPVFDRLTAAHDPHVGPPESS
jgi:hypothetical protein